jgi:hypothetical protein
MPDIPEEAVREATEAYSCAWTSGVSSHDDLVWIVLEAAAPLIEARVRRDLLAAAQSCTTCGEIHQRRPVKGDSGISYMSWAHPEDGHAYFQASQDGAAWLARQIGEAREPR